MFKKIWYLISLILGILIFLKLFKSRESVVKYLPEKVEEKKRALQIEATKEEKLDLNVRQKEILKLLRKRNVLLPSDIYALHPNVSTRTLRRDMTGLVESKLVRQEGSTRDTRYFLIS